MEDDFQEMKILNYASDVILRIQHFFNGDNLWIAFSCAAYNLIVNDNSSYFLKIKKKLIWKDKNHLKTMSWLMNLFVLNVTKVSVDFFIYSIK